MNKPPVNTPSQDATTELSIPVADVRDALEDEKSTVDGADTEPTVSKKRDKSKHASKDATTDLTIPVADVRDALEDEKSTIDDADTEPTVSKKRDKLKHQKINV